MTKSNWLRSEIEKLERMKHSTQDCDCEGFGCPRNLILTSIITRYKEELKVLEKVSHTKTDKTTEV